ncbi:MAG: hypothetical protein HY671_08835 [Chloroflexi bacterium]|nr:hypothetical protein [Chloroflexota bacterium]
MRGTKTKQANFSLPDELLEELRREVPRGEHSKIVAEALRKELFRLRFRRALGNAFGAWKDVDHPELEEGTERFVRRLRHSSRTNEQEGRAT